jgi:hypothetical protein
VSKIFTEKKDFKRLSQMCDYTVAHLDSFPAGTPAAAAAPNAVAVVIRLKERTATHVSLGQRIRELKRERDEGREDLRQEVLSLYHTAEGIAASVPGFNVQFRLSLQGDSKLVAAARSAIEKATPHVDLFIQHAKPADFLETLKQKLNRFEKLVEESVNVRNALKMGPQELQDLLDQALGTWRTFDAIVRNTVSKDRLALAAWKLACRLPRNAKSKTASSAEPATTSESTSEAVA